MAVRSDLSARACTIARGVDVLGDAWVALILRELFLGNRRFDAIVEAVDGAESVIARRLATLVEHGLVVKRDYRDARRTRSEYVLTDAGIDTLPVLHALNRWGAVHNDPHGTGLRLRVECLGCGGEPDSADWCATCARPLTVHTTAWRKARSPEVLRPLVVD